VSQQTQKKPLLYCVGVGGALILGGYVGHFLFLGCATWYYGGSPIESIVQGHSSTGTDMRLPLYSLVSFESLCAIIAGLLMLMLYQRTIGRSILNRESNNLRLFVARERRGNRK
jgi:hypothetical protein